MPRTAKPYGKGSVFERKDRPGTWVASVPVGNGQRVTEQHRSKVAAERARKHILRERDAGLRQPVTTFWTVGDLLREWLREEMQLRLSETSLAEYQRAVQVDLMPRFGRYRLVDLTPLTIHVELRAWRQKPVTTGRLQFALARLRQALDWAVGMDLIPRNPADKVPPPSLTPRCPTAKNTGGRPPANIDQVQQRGAEIEAMRTCGVKWPQIAQHFDRSEDTVQRWHREWLRQSPQKPQT